MTEESNQSPEEFKQIRLEKREEMQEEGIEPYPRQYTRTHTAKEARRGFDPDEDEKLGSEVQVAGRIVAERLHGGAAFLDLQDQSGKIQVYLSGEYLDRGEQFQQFETYWDIGDVVGVRGELFETGEGEVSVLVREATFLSKGLRPLPEKFHGLQDRELRYRKRYLDLISNEDVRETFRIRSEFISQLRRQLESEGFMEVETPMMQSIPGGAEAEPFKTHHNALDRDLFLRIAPELFLKRLVVGGFENVFEINRNFRNEGISTSHNPEFTMLELYEAYSDYRDVMDLTERLLSSAVEAIHGDLETTFEGDQIDWSRPWERRPLLDLVRDETGLDLSLDQSSEEVYERASEQGIDVEPCEDTGEQIVAIFEETVEDTLQQPVFVTDFPASLSPLAKQHREDPNLSERFELFAGGLEIGNAYTELNDPVLQRENFQAQVSDSEDIDEDYLEALEYGMPPAGGLGLGIDRIIMLLTDSSSIRDVILFPLLREAR